MGTVDAPYTKPGRLADVLALIQVLALDPHTRRRETGVTKELQGRPASAESWFALAREHHEFFRLDKEVDYALSLVARDVLQEDESGKRPPLSPDFVAVLLRTAIDIHDRQVEAKDRWKQWIPLVSSLLAAAIGASASLLALWLKGR